MNINNTSIEAAGEPLATSDVLIVGAGIIGLAHAAIALDKGLSVTVIDRDHRAVGASIRNFGHACITAQSGELYELAQNGRKHWLEFSRRAGFWAAEAGALVVATTRTEMAVLREFADSRPGGQITLLDAESVRSRLGRDDTEGILGGAFLADDLRVDPRTTVGTLAAWVDAEPEGRVMFNTAARGFGAGTQRTAAVHTSRGRLEADHVFICVGHDIDYLFPDLAAEHRIQRCTLQMTAAQAPAGTRITEAVLSATSMLRYEAFTEVPSAAALRAEVAANSPELLAIGANVMFTQRPDGTLLLGDSHAYDSTASPFLSEETTNRLLRAAQGILGTGDLHLTERWQGIYASSEVAPLFIKDIGPGITAVSVTAGIGMTISFGLAERNLASL